MLDKVKRTVLWNHESTSVAVVVAVPEVVDFKLLHQVLGVQGLAERWLG